MNLTKADIVVINANIVKRPTADWNKLKISIGWLEQDVDYCFFVLLLSVNCETTGRPHKQTISHWKSAALWIVLLHDIILKQLRAEP